MKVKEVITEGLGDLAAQFVGGLAGKSASQVKYEKEQAAADKEEREAASQEEKEARAKGMTVEEYRKWKQDQADKAQAAQKEINDRKTRQAAIRAKNKARKQASGRL